MFLFPAVTIAVTCMFFIAGGLDNAAEVPPSGPATTSAASEKRRRKRGPTLYFTEWWICVIAARALATYLIPGCVGRGVKLGSENSSGGGAGGVWKSGNVSLQNVHGKCFTAKCSRNNVQGKCSRQMFMPRDIRSS